MEQARVLFIGLGSLGSRVLDMFLAASHRHHVTVAGRRVTRTTERVNLSRLVALSLGYDHDVDVTEIDLTNVEHSATVLARVRPDIVFVAVSIQSWWVIQELPPKDFECLDAAQFGPWLPMHLTLVRNLMLAVKASGLSPKVINCSFPDAVNPILHTVGLAPTTGIGNVSNPVPALCAAIASQLSHAVSRIQVRFVAQHYVSHRLSRTGDAGKAPFHLSAYADGVDVTRTVDIPAALRFVATRIRKTGGEVGQILTAASAIGILRAMADDSGAFCHAPGPGGLPGGYPVNVFREHVTLALPPQLSLEDAIGINLEGLRFDGIDRIEPGGHVHFTEDNMAIMKELLGYSHASMCVNDADLLATELSERYLLFANRCRR